MRRNRRKPSYTRLIRHGWTARLDGGSTRTDVNWLSSSQLYSSVSPVWTFESRLPRRSWVRAFALSAVNWFRTLFVNPVTVVWFVRQRETKAQESGNKVAAIHRLLPAVVQLAVQFIRTIRNGIVLRMRWLAALAPLGVSMAVYL
jgi:hypothetical protein